MIAFHFLTGFIVGMTAVAILTAVGLPDIPSITVGLAIAFAVWYFYDPRHVGDAERLDEEGPA